jgi:CheY-like chemotaxis protein
MTTMLRVLITDDEEDARDKLRRLLLGHVDITVVGEATNGRDAWRRSAPPRRTLFPRHPHARARWTRRHELTRRT